MTRIRSASLIVLSLWATITWVQPRRLRLLINFCSVSVSRAEVASSMIRMLGLFTRALASSSLWR